MVGIRIISMSEAMSHSFTLTELKKILTGLSQQSLQNFGLIPLFHGFCDMSWKPTHPACRIWQLQKGSFLKAHTVHTRMIIMHIANGKTIGYCTVHM